MRKHVQALFAPRSFGAGTHPLMDAIGALSICVTFVGLMFLPTPF